MNLTENETSLGGSSTLCDNFTSLISMASIQFLSFLSNLVAAIAIWKLPGLEENKYHLVVRTLVISDLLIPLSTLPLSIVSYANCAWIGGTILCSVSAFVSTKILKLVIFHRLYNVLSSFSRRHKTTILQKPSHIRKSAESPGFSPLLALHSFGPPCFGFWSV